MQRQPLQVFGLCLCLAGVTAAGLAFTVTELTADKTSLIRQVEQLPAYPLTVIGNESCPLRITEAQVKAIPASLYTQLTGQTTSLALVASVPHIKLVNVSGRTIKGYVLSVFSPTSDKSIGICSFNPIPPGAQVTISTNHFAGYERITRATSDGVVTSENRLRGWDSPKKWINFASPEELQMAIDRVELEDGSQWNVPKGAVTK